MQKEFTLRGRTVADLKNMELTDFIQLLPSRQRRSLSKGFTDQQKCLLEKIRRNPSAPVKTHCVLPDTTIIANDTPKTISSIKEGEKVLTHQGRFQKITKVFKRKYEGDVITIISYSNSSNPLTITPEHPVLAIKTKKCIKPYLKRLYCKPNKYPYCYYCKQRETLRYELSWIPAKNLKRGDIVVIPRLKDRIDTKKIKILEIINDPNYYVKEGIIYRKQTSSTKIGIFNRVDLLNSIKVDKNFMRLVGYYLAEGCTRKNNITFSFNKNELDYLKDVEILMKKVFGISHKKETIEKDNTTHLIFYSMVLMKLFKNLFGNKAENKHIPVWMLYLPKEMQKELILSLWRGDGSLKYNCFEFSSASKILSDQVQTILQRIGFVTSIHITKPEVNLKQKSEMFRIRLAGNQLKDASKLLKVSHPHLKNRNRTSSMSWIDNDYMYSPIRKISKGKYSGNVCNLEVKGDNSYISNNITVHNCRDMIVIPEMLGSTLLVYNGHVFSQVLIIEEMLGHYLGELSLTRQKVKHSAPGVGATKSSAAISVK